MDRNFLSDRRRTVSLVSKWLVASLVTITLAIPPTVSSSQQETDERTHTEPNRNGWSRNVDGIAIRVSPLSKRKWGLAEIPTFKLEAKNVGKNQKTVLLNSATAKLTVDGTEFRIPPSVTLNCELKGNSKVGTLLRLRLSQADWDKAGSRNESKNLLAALSDLGIGKHKIQFQFGSDEKQLSTGEFEFEVTNKDFENPNTVYSLKDFYGNPLTDAKVYPIGGGRMSIQYVELTNSGFGKKHGGHYETEVEMGQKFRQIEPTVTDEDGRFSINALPNDTRIVIVPKVGSVQVIPISELKGPEVKLAQTGNLIIKRDVDGDETPYRVDVYRMPTNSEIRQQELGTKYISEYIQFAQKNGESYLLQKLRPGKYKIRTTKSVRKERHIEYVSAAEKVVEIKADETTRFVTEYKKGQKIKVKVVGLNSNIDFVKARLVLPGEIPNSYRSTSYWGDGKFDVKKSAEFLSHKVPPGNYTLFVEATPGMDPGADAFAASPNPTHMAAKTVVVQTDGVVDAGTIKLMPKELWLKQSPNTLRMKLVDKKGALIKDAIVFRLYKGVPNDGVRIFNKSEGDISTQVKFGEHQFLLASPTMGTMIFNVTVPNMVAHKIVVNGIPDWYNEAKAKAALRIKTVVENNDTSPVIKVLIENASDEDIAIPNSTIRFSTSKYKSSQIQLALVCYFPDRLNNQRMVFRAKSKTELQFKWGDMIKNGYWRGVDFRKMSFSDVKPIPGKSAAKFEVGPASSNIFYVPNTN